MFKPMSDLEWDAAAARHSKIHAQGFTMAATKRRLEAGGLHYDRPAPAAPDPMAAAASEASDSVYVISGKAAHYERTAPAAPDPMADAVAKATEDNRVDLIKGRPMTAYRVVK